MIQLILAFLLPVFTTLFPQFGITYGLFFITVCMCQLTEGGHFVLLPTVFAKLFGVEGGLRVYSIGFSFVGVASLLNQLFLYLFLDGKIGDLGY